MAALPSRGFPVAVLGVGFCEKPSENQNSVWLGRVAAFLTGKVRTDQGEGIIIPRQTARIELSAIIEDCCSRSPVTTLGAQLET
jgi:hypothetical protein